jgi:pimeloyl-ACP methyl ester carboxylesterase
VILPGIQDDPEIPLDIIETIGNFDCMAVNYPTKRFSDRELVDAVIVRLGQEKVEEVLFIGISMGGLLAAQIITELSRRPVLHIKPVGLVLWNSPRRIEDLYQAGRAKWAVRLLRPISWLLNPLSRPLFERLNGSQPPAPLEEQADAAALARAHEFALKEKASAYLAKLRYIGHAKRLKFRLGGIKVVYVHASLDDVVRMQAIGHWLDSLPRGTRATVAAVSTHCGFTQAPKANQQALRAALRFILQDESL